MTLFCCIVNFKHIQYFNPFHATNLFLYPLKHQETSSLCMFSMGMNRDHLYKMG